MAKMKRLIRKTDWSKIYVVLEYIIAVYIALTGILNLLNYAGIMTYEKWVMKPTFLGSSWLILLLLQHFLIAPSRNDQHLAQLRPYVTGIIIAGIVSGGNVPLVLLLLLVKGYFLLTGFGKKYSLKTSILTALVACVGMELYSVAVMISKSAMAYEKGFLNSVWPDVLLVLAAIIYFAVNKEDESSEENKDNVETSKAVECVSEKKEKAESKSGREKAPKEKLAAKIMSGVTWIQANSKLIARCIGGGLCVVSMGLFLFYIVSTTVATNRLENSAEEVYLWQNCEDRTLVLTMVKDKETDTYRVAFQKYTGANNQKLRMYDMGDGIYLLLFAENNYALETIIDEETGAYILQASPLSDNLWQLWHKQDFIPEENKYRFLCAYCVPICYQLLGETVGIPEVAIQADTGWNECFTLERTTEDEFVTKMVSRHGEEFRPTIMMETMIGCLGGWSCIVFVVIILQFCAIIYARRLVGDKTAVLYALVFAFLLAYASVVSIVLLLLTYGVVCVIGYQRRYEKQKPEAVKQYNEGLSYMVKSEMKESLDNMEKILREMRENLPS